MKELTIEEKAKRYDEALERAKGVIEQNPLMEYLKKGIEYILPELKENEDYRIRKAVIAAVETLSDSPLKVKMLAWLEKQGEQKPVDKVEPKFKVGDWVIDKQDIVHQIANVVEIVTNHTYGYDIVGGGYFNDNTEGVRLWTIQDAKAGDVLSYENEIFIVKKSVNLNIIYYCCYDKEHFIIDSIYSLTIDDIDNIRPATKEQRELLFAKMKEAGYEWDAEKKELKKIENKLSNEEMKELLQTEYEKGRADAIAEMQKPWSEEDEAYRKLLIDIMDAEHKGGIFSINPQDISIFKSDVVKVERIKNWLKSLKNRVLPQSRQEWSEDDENRINRLIAYFEDKESFTAEDDIVYANWFKSLKDRYTWKPSDSQMGALWDSIKHNLHLHPVLESLYNDLKKLKG